ncbi:hypothetical protein PMAYCL1PPCAC_02457, partial [Pristionchus mayeri]
SNEFSCEPKVHFVSISSRISRIQTVFFSLLPHLQSSLSRFSCNFHLDCLIHLHLLHLLHSLMKQTNRCRYSLIFEISLVAPFQSPSSSSTPLTFSLTRITHAINPETSFH